MAEDPNTTKTTDSPAEPQERTIPYARFKEVNDRLADERRSRSELEERMSQLEDRDKTDVERLTRELEKAQKKAVEADERATALEAAREKDAKVSLIAAAAAKLKFHDPTLASQIVNLDEIDDAKAAEAAVKAIAKERPYLVQQDDPTKARLQRVGVSGDVVDESKEKGLVTEDELKKAWGEQMLAGLTGQNAEKQQQV